VTQIGARLSSAAIFPQGCNVGFVERRSRTSLALRVWERGVGETLACGTGACAAMAVQRKRGRLTTPWMCSFPAAAWKFIGKVPVIRCG
jgi:diaminopimelate epimerase